MKIIKFLRSIHYGNREFFGSEYNKLRKVKISEKSFNRYLVDWKKEGLFILPGADGIRIFRKNLFFILSRMSTFFLDGWISGSTMV